MIEYTFEQFLQNYDPSKEYAYFREGNGICLVTDDLQKGYKVDIILIDLSDDKHKILPVYANTYETKLEYISKLIAPCKERIYQIDDYKELITLNMMRELTT